MLSSNYHAVTMCFPTISRVLKKQDRSAYRIACLTTPCLSYENLDSEANVHTLMYVRVTFIVLCTSIPASLKIYFKGCMSL